MLDDAQVAAALATLPEQTGYIYSLDNQLLYTGKRKSDFQPSADFLEQSRHHKQHFEFTSPDHRYPVSGVTHKFKRPGERGKYLAIVTAY